MNMDMDPYRYVEYYHSQIGGGNYFHGAPVQYGQNGRGLGALFGRLFRFVAPLVKTGVKIAKPHLKTAAKSIAGEIASSAMRKIMSPAENENQNQQGKGGIRTLSRLARISPPGSRRFKKRRSNVSPSFDKRARQTKKSSHSERKQFIF